MNQAQAEPVRQPTKDAQAPQGLELRHLRYFATVADAGTFTRAADQMFIAQPTLSQQIRRLEEIIGTPLLHRRRDGVRLTAAGTVLLDAARDVLSQVDHGVSRTRQAAGLGRQRLRVIIPPRLPEALAVTIASTLRSAAAAADVDVAWMETPLDAEFSPIRQHHADAGLGWLTTSPDTLPAPLDAMSLGEFEPEVWIPCSHPAARRGTISLAEVADMDVIFGPRHAEPGTYHAWTSIVRAVNPRLTLTDPPFRHSLPMTLAFAATASRPTAVLTGPGTTAHQMPPPHSASFSLPAANGTDHARTDTGASSASDHVALQGRPVKGAPCGRIRAARERVCGAPLTLETCQPGEPDGEGQASEARPGTRAANLLILEAAATAAEPALQILVGNAMLHTPCLELSDINRIGQSPRRLVSKFWPPGVTQQVHDVLPAVLFRPHGYHQSLLRPDVAVAQVSGRRRPLVRHHFTNYFESEPNRSSLVREAPDARTRRGPSVRFLPMSVAECTADQPPPEPSTSAGGSSAVDHACE